MSGTATKELIRFFSISFFFATAVTIAMYAFELPAEALVLVMGSVFFSAIVCEKIDGVSVAKNILSQFTTVRWVKIVKSYAFFAVLFLCIQIMCIMLLSFVSPAFGTLVTSDVAFQQLNAQVGFGYSQTMSLVQAAFGSVLMAIILGATISGAFAFLEEYAWRGYVYQKTAELSYFKQDMIIGVLWGLWHAPAIMLLGLNYPDNRLEGVILMVIFTTVVSFVFNAMRRSSGSVVLSAMGHGFINAAGAQILFFAGQPDGLLGPVTGLSGIMAFLITYAVMRFGAVTARTT
ncbi:CPBP family intramembrane metalloprotease [Candidatus Kaiserbacteria bacterium]|nr:CPBP family intramembrane metalloprotease [Candidatus Kaiserbacteria bacterium]USN88469.1 MAG: CPBP family intramembrane metalloprotease [Candidatus Nomurabacteria bacterium]